MSRVFTVFVGNTSPSVLDTISVAGAAQDLTGATVRFRMRPVHSTALKVDAPGVVVTPAAGVVRYDWVVGDLDTEGRYAAWWQVTFASGRIQDTPEFDIDVEAHDPLDVTGAAPAVGPCSAWCTAEDVDEAYPGGVPGDYADWTMAASQVLHELSARQFGGACTYTIRPCSAGCGCWDGGVGPLALRGLEAAGVRVGPGGCGSWASRCSCGVVSEVLLPGYPVVSISEVRIDGVVVNPLSYRVDNRAYLVRTDGGFWPACQDVGSAAGSAGTWTVTYVAGVSPPEIARLAAIELAYHLSRAFRGESCGLPSGARKVTRQGVTVDRQGVAFLARELRSSASREAKSSGLMVVDAFIAAYNPHGHRRAAAVWTPDRPSMGRRQTAP